MTYVAGARIVVLDLAIEDLGDRIVRNQVSTQVRSNEARTAGDYRFHRHEGSSGSSLEPQEWYL